MFCFQIWKKNREIKRQTSKTVVGPIAIAVPPKLRTSDYWSVFSAYLHTEVKELQYGALEYLLVWWEAHFSGRWNNVHKSFHRLRTAVHNSDVWFWALWSECSMKGSSHRIPVFLFPCENCSKPKVLMNLSWVSKKSYHDS